MGAFDLCRRSHPRPHEFDAAIFADAGAPARRTVADVNDETEAAAAADSGPGADGIIQRLIFGFDRPVFVAALFKTREAFSDPNKT